MQLIILYAVESLSKKELIKQRISPIIIPIIIIPSILNIIFHNLLNFIVFILSIIIKNKIIDNMKLPIILLQN